MNADINLMYTRTSHPLRVNGDAIHVLALWLRENGDAIHVLALWLRENGPRQIRQQPDWRSVMSERYPAGLFSEDEVHVLCDLLKSL